MKKTIFTLIFSVIALVAMADDVMKKEGNTYIINTTTLCNTKGFKSTTPVEVYIEKNKVVKVIPLKNMESKGYFARVVKFLFPKYESLKVSKAKKLSNSYDVDGCTGATYSVKAVQKNIHAALTYYQDHK